MVSPSERPEFFSSDLLVEVARLAWEEILTCAKKTKPLPSKPGSRIAYALFMIARQLAVVQLFQLPATTQDLSHRALQDLLRFCNVRSIVPS